MTLGPMILKYLKNHPEIWQDIVDALKKVIVRRAADPGELLKTIAALREQVVYLLDSADDDGEVVQAEAWSRRLDHLERVAKLLVNEASKHEVKELREQVFALRKEIIEAFVIEQVEDAAERRSLK
ncbi:hypothetical protein [Agrococcus sp. Marseille-Q4369]|uniref:hypothetical protein n=1 Tax=Agrococcus sp. Marseille-Q4369 TaxID=2810513 RepID=UPI001B8C8FFE|nr:hypothetical protein [Agrococcus sp. Marseille-Q4369]QUW17862.1 hypothetical protein JSQ78_08275 [Agrococcus sp. Marseille-Q4369]